MTDLLTDEAVEAVREHFSDGDRSLRILLAAFVAHHEGERPCETCRGEGVRYNERDSTDERPYICPTCNGKGTVRADRLVLESEARKWVEVADEMARADERQKAIRDVAEELRRVFGRWPADHIAEKFGVRP